jgi:hypothetical protein
MPLLSEAFSDARLNLDSLDMDIKAAEEGYAAGIPITPPA